MSLEQRHERFDSSTITMVAASVGFWLFINWPFQYVATAHQTSRISSALSDYNYQPYLFPDYEVIHGGFPFTYVAGEGDVEAVGPGDWSWKWLVLNLLIAVVTTIALPYAVYKARQYFAVKHLKLRLGLVCGLALLVAFLSCIVAFNDRADRQLARELSTVGAVHRYSLIPKPVVRIIPEILLVRFARIRGIVIWGRSPDLISRATRISTLTSFGSIGQTLTAQDLSVIANAGRFNHLNLRRIKLDEAACQEILRSASLRKLELTACEGLQSYLCDFSQLNHLRELKLTNSDSRLSTLPATSWPESLKILDLSRPFRGSDSLTLHDLPKLESLYVQRTDFSFNSDLVSIDIANVPSLKHLSIETMQKVSLKIESAPKLESIGTGDRPMDLRVDPNEIVPSSLWVESLHLDDLPSLRELNCDGSNFKKLSLQRMPNLHRLSIGRMSLSGAAMRKLDAQFKSRAQSIIEDLAFCDGPTKLDLSSLPLAGVDLESLSKNKRIRSLTLIGCGINGTQLPAISKLSRLSKLDLRSCPILDTEALEMLRNGLPLTELLVSSDQFERIEVIDQSILRGFVTTDSLLAKTVQISGSPQLESELVLGGRVRYLEIQDGYSLLGLSVNGLIPPDAVLKGLRSLKFFAIGGPRADDELCRNLWQCKDLDHLTIAYGRLSRQSLVQIGQFPKLTTLILPGSDIDDELVVSHWSALTHLSDINFSDTAISSKTIAFLYRLNNLQKLSINYSHASQDDLAGLVNIRQLVELEVAGIGLNSETLASCLRRGMMDRLDLSDTKLDDEDIQILAGRAGNSLRFLGLKGCGLTETQLRRIINAHPDLTVDIKSNEVSDEYNAELLQQKRLLDRLDRDGFLRHLARTHGNVSDANAEYKKIRGYIDHNQFIDVSPRAARSKWRLILVDRFGKCIIRRPTRAFATSATACTSGSTSCISATAD